MSTEQKTVDDAPAELDSLIRSQPLPMIQKSINAFRRDLPEMLKTHRGQWVAYQGDRRIGFGLTETQLYQECFQRGLTRDEFVVGYVEPCAFDPDEEFEGSIDV